MAANVYASATDGGSGGDSAQTRSGTGVRTAGATIDCPDVGSKLTSVPEQARGRSTRNSPCWTSRSPRPISG